jgi:phosphoserine phosphatase
MRRFETLSTRRDIAKSRVEMAGWYSGVINRELCAPLADATWRSGAREAIGLLQKSGIEVAIASITWRFAIEYLAGPLGVSNVLGTELGPSGAIQHVWPSDKGRWLRSLAKERQVQRHRIAAVGDSIKDRHLLYAASLRFFVGDGFPPTIRGLRVRREGDILGITREILGAWSPL